MHREPPGGRGRREPTRGQVVTGPGFYVWEEDPSQARQWAAELADMGLAARAPHSS